MAEDAQPSLNACFGTADPAELPAAFDAALNSGNVDALVSLFHPDATMRMTDGNMASGEEALRHALSILVSGRPILHNTVRHSIVSSEVALLIVDWEIRVPVPGQADLVERGTATQVAQSVAPGKWLLRISNPLGTS